MQGVREMCRQWKRVSVLPITQHETLCRNRSPRNSLSFSRRFSARSSSLGSASGDTIDLMWDRHPQSQVGYVVHMGIQSGTYTQHIDVGSMTAWSFTNAAAGQKYCFTVTAYSIKTSRRASLERSVRLEQCATSARQSRDAKLEGWTASEPSAHWQQPEGRCVDLQCDRPSTRAEADGVNRLCFGNSDGIGQLFGDGAGAGR